MLIMGDDDVAKLVPGSISFAHQLHVDARTRVEQAATYFFMLSHFLADCCMPCHCDARSLAGYSKGLHHELEKHWGKTVGNSFKKAKLAVTSDSDREVIERARTIDAAFGLQFQNVIPDIIASDTWAEAVSICRASFALASIISPPVLYPYGSKEHSPFDDLFCSPFGKELLAEVDRVVLHDAVLNTAIVWKHVWSRFD
jgi:hypothetical protein